MTVFVIGAGSSPIQAQDNERTRASLKGISSLSVLIENLPDGAKVLGLTKESIQTDVELKLRLAGIRVLTPEEDYKVLGSPYLYVDLNLTNSAQAASIEVELHQDARLDLNGQPAIGVTTWDTGYLVSNPTAQGVRDRIKDLVDKFLNVWLSVNPKK
jgi:hypothetical protein